jgi:hypothetical protein
VKNSTQRSAILGVLTSAPGDWVPLPRITDCAAQYNARIYELRRLGFRIVNRTEDFDGVRHSWFRLESYPASAAAAPPAIPTETLPLFAEGGRS